MEFEKIQKMIRLIAYILTVPDPSSKCSGAKSILQRPSATFGAARQSSLFLRVKRDARRRGRGVVEEINHSALRGRPHANILQALDGAVPLTWDGLSVPVFFPSSLHHRRRPLLRCV